MWARFKASINKDGKDSKDGRKSLNVKEEYLCALRSKSYADLLSKAQSLVNEPKSPSYRVSYDILLEPGQETIVYILESAVLLSKKSDLKALILDYFDISAEASKICSHLLRSIIQIQTNCSFIQQALDTVDQDNPEQYAGLIISELSSSIILGNVNPIFSDLNKQDLEIIRDKYSSVLQHLKSKRRKVTRKIKLIKWFNKASGICVTAACGLVAIAAIALAAHTLAALVMAPAILSLPVKPLKKKLFSLQFLRSGFLSKVGEQLDVAAKGTYILNRDFDTISRLVARLQNEIDYSKEMIQFCLDRRDDKFSMQVLKELKKSNVGFRTQVEELQEHVYLCLVSINRSRALLIKEIPTTCAQDLQK